MATVSVIVPVYNAEDCLDKCVDSVLKQTYSDWELILVNDGSRDNSGMLCDAYAARDSRVHVIHQENGGAGAARDAGLDYVMDSSESQWVCFVDSDDWAHPRMLELLLKTALEQQTQISLCSYVETKDEQIPTVEGDYSIQIWTPDALYQQKTILATVPWGKLYAKSCFAEIRYPKGTYLDDEYVTYRLLFAQQMLPVISMPLYIYYWNSQGLTKAKWDPRRIEVWDAFEQQVAFFQKLGKPDLVNFRYRGYLENAMVNYQAARKAAQTPEVRRAIRRMDRQIPRLLQRMWKAGCIEFWMDFDILLYFRPVWARIQRFLLEHRQN